METLAWLFGQRRDQSTASQPVQSRATDQSFTVPTQSPTGWPPVNGVDVSKVGTLSQPPTNPNVEGPLDTQSSARQQKPPVIFAAGVAFTAFSILITRRSFARRRLAFNPALQKYPIGQGSPAPQVPQAENAKVSGAMEAFEALNIATVNLLSMATLVTGGALWYFDISSMEDARRKLRGGIGIDGSGRSEAEAEEDFEEWLATVLSRKEAKERKMEYEGEKETTRKNDRGKER